ncbi:MAG: hypothetical protein H6898_10265 [Rhodobacter sp.]|nr:hypothetical protein [Rhodobacter sp.]
MFRGWGFLLGEIWVLIALAALIGLFIGWLIWGRRAAAATETGEVARLQSELTACQARARDCAQRMARLEEDLATALAAQAVPVEGDTEGVGDAAAAAEAAPATEDAAEDVGTRPEALAAPRAGQADDLKRIKGIGPKLEQLCNRLGFWHFDQIANWTGEEIAWVDANLEAFKGRVTRDNWVEQARALAAEGQG